MSAQYPDDDEDLTVSWHVYQPVVDVVASVVLVMLDVAAVRMTISMVWVTDLVLVASVVVVVVLVAILWKTNPS